MKNIMMIAVEYPPCISGGVQRTLKFSEHLPKFGWHPLVLAAGLRAYENIDCSASFPDGVSVYRAFAFDSLQQLRVRGKYLGFTVMPDRYVTWLPAAVIKGIWLAKKYRPSVIYSTFPYSTAHWVAMEVARWTGIPWIADFRDPAHHHYMESNLVNPLSIFVDKKTVKRADHFIFATERMRDCYLEAYPNLKDESVSVIENGFNENLFNELVGSPSKSNEEKFVILHSGVLHEDRDPLPLIVALGELIEKHGENSKYKNICIHFRGAEPSVEERQAIEGYRLTDQVRFLPPISFKESIREMLLADALLLLQGALFNYQIPGKVYEYIAANKPILGLVDRDGATAALLESVPGAEVVVSGAPSDIAKALELILEFPEITRNVADYSRFSKTKDLAHLLDGLI